MIYGRRDAVMRLEKLQGGKKADQFLKRHSKSVRIVKLKHF